MGWVIAHTILLLVFCGLAVWCFRHPKTKKWVAWFDVGIAILTIALLVMDGQRLKMEHEIARRERVMAHLSAGMEEALQVPDPQNYGVIHRPKAGCPPGFKERDDIFIRDGHPVPACVNRKNPNGMTDYLMPGESQTFTGVIMPPDASTASKI